MGYRESTYNVLKLAMDYLDTLPTNNPTNAIWWCLHQIVWHAGVDRVQWILDNKELVKKIANQDILPDDETMKEFRASIVKMDKYRR